MSAGQKYELVALGGSNGALDVVTEILGGLPDKINYALVIVLHQSRQADSLLQKVLQVKTKLRVNEPLDKEPVEKGSVYIAIPNYHLMIEKDKTFAYSYSELVNYSRPSIDVFFETAASAYQSRMAAIILTGANADGASGIVHAKQSKALTIAQNPSSALSPFMPESAIKTGCVDMVLNISEIITTLTRFNEPDYK
jgi:two-component system chemotaxis response regulator CheB